MVLPPFSLDKPNNQDIINAKNVLDGYRKTNTICENDSYMWLQRQIYESSVHPVTKEVIFPLFRVSAIAPVNIPIVSLMLAIPPSNVPLTLFIHFVNQSYNSACNYANRSGESLALTQTLTAYGLAVSSACGFAYGLGKVNALKRFGFAIPLLATSIANISNIGFTRLNELTEGAPVFDATGKNVGLSKIAGGIGVWQTTLTRCLAVPCSCLLIPPVIMTGLKKIPAFPRDPRFLMGVELLSIYLSIQIALPAALAVFPQNYEISVDKLEPKFQGLVDSNGNKVLSVFGNKGL